MKWLLDSLAPMSSGHGRIFDAFEKKESIPTLALRASDQHCIVDESEEHHARTHPRRTPLHSLRVGH